MKDAILVASLLSATGCSWWERTQTQIVESKYAVNNCLHSQFEDLRKGDRTIRFGGDIGNAYTPRCMMVGLGQDVTFSGDFSVHPLTPGAAPSIVNGYF